MDTDIALLGLSGSGKTNFINEVMKDINVFSPKISIKMRYPVMPYPAAAKNTEIFSRLSFALDTNGGEQWNFNVCDYNGELLKTREEDNEYFANVKKHLQSSDEWIVFVDGNHFTEGTKEETVRLIKRKTARVLLPYISEYADEHNETTPELLFVVTKAGEIVDRFSKETVKEIIMESFEGVFSEEYSPMVLMSETETTRSVGMAILTLFYLRYSDELENRALQLNKRNQQIEDDISELRNSVREIESKKILRKTPGNRRKVEDYNRRIWSLRGEIESNIEKLKQCRNNIGMKHIGTALQCLIDNNPHLTVNGFGRINYPYDRSVGKVVVSNQCFAVAVLIHLLTVAAFVNEAFAVGIMKALVPVIALVVCTILMVGAKKNLAKVFGGICFVAALAWIGCLSGVEGWMLLVGCIISAVTTSTIIIGLNGWKNKKATGSLAKYKDEVTRFFATKVKEKK